MIEVMENELEPYENTLTIDVLRRELRFSWNNEHAFTADLKRLPEAPSIGTLHFLTNAAMGSRHLDYHDIGTQMQRDHGLDAVPPKCEYECAAGLWFVIRQGILAARTKKALESDGGGE